VRNALAVAVTMVCLSGFGIFAVPVRAQEPHAGTVIVPPSNAVPPQDRGKRAHTNFLIFIRASRSGKPSLNTISTPSGETPSSLACVYQVGRNNTSTGCPAVESGNSMNYDNPAGGSNVIAIVDAYDYPTAASDFQTFSQKFGLPYGNECGSSGTQACFTKVYASGSQPKSNGGWAQEEALDIEWSHAMAPYAQIVLVEAASNSNNDLMQAVNYANSIIASAGGKGEVSMSWGSSESSSETSLDSYFTQPGVTYFASSGDSGGKVIWPSASPYVVSAGGTTVNRDSSGNFTGETTWSSAGGGPSSYEVMPPYQDVTADINTSGMRGTPDISFDANPASGVSVYDSTPSQGLSGWLVFGGTSVASPSLAGIVNNAGAFDGGWDGGGNPTSVQNNLYTNYGADLSSSTDPTACSYTSSTPFYDVQSGSAGTYSAGACWDFASGIGTERGLNGPTGSTGPSFSVSASPTSVSVTQGSSTNATSTITVTPSSTFTGSVDLTATAPNGSGLNVSVSPTSVSSSNSWTATLSVGAGSATAGTYTVTVSGTSSGASSSSTTVTVTVNGPPAAPTNLQASAGNAQVSLTWTASSGATSYDVLRSTTSGQESSLASVNSTSYTDTSVTNGTTYYYEIEAVNSYGPSGPSNEASATPAATGAGSFTVTAANFTVIRGSSGSTTVTVTPSGGFTGSVTLAVTRLPRFANGSFSVNPVSISGSTAGTSAFTVSTNKHVATGTYTLTITGTSGSLSSSTTVTLTITP
jgi:kumamolisin